MDDRFSSANVHMANTYERLLSTNIFWEKRRESFVPQRENLLGEDSICIVNLLEIPVSYTHLTLPTTPYV